MLRETGVVLLRRVEIGLGDELQHRRRPPGEKGVERQSIVILPGQRPGGEVSGAERGGRGVRRRERADGRAEHVGDDLGDVAICRCSADEDDVAWAMRGVAVARPIGREGRSHREHCKVSTAR